LIGSFLGGRIQKLRQPIYWPIRERKCPAHAADDTYVQIRRLSLERVR